MFMKKKLAEELKLQSGAIVAFIWECKKTKNVLLETLYKERLIHMTGVACGIYKKDLITQKQYKEISDINMAFINEEKKQNEASHWVEDVLHKVHIKDGQDRTKLLFTDLTENLQQLFDAIDDDDEDEDDVSYNH